MAQRYVHLLLTFVSFSAEICLVIIERLVESKISSDEGILSRSIYKTLGVSSLTIANGVIFEFSVDVICSHLSLRVRLTHVLKDDLRLHSVVHFWSGSVLICPHDFHLGFAFLSHPLM